MQRVALVTAALVAAVAVWALSLPPRRTALASTFDDGTVRGLLHVHSRASDGRGTLDEIAIAAARAGLQFVVVTDHGDGTRRPEAPAYRAGVLLIDGVEISTRGGHYVAIGLPQTPYALGGEAADVVEDVRRLGGLGIAAHPDSPKAGLRWQDWGAPIDGFELVNPDTSWRLRAFSGGVAAKWLLLRSLLAYPVRPSESIAQLLTSTSALRERWAGVAAQRPLTAFAGADAHAKLSLRDTEPGDNRYSIPIPGYQSSFESLSVHVVPDHQFAGDASSDGSALLGGLRRGHVYLAVDGWATPPAFEFSATSGASRVTAGESVRSGAPVTLHVRSNAPPGFRTIVWKGATRLTERNEPAFEVPVGSEPAVYSVEVRRANAPDMPAWITSNPIYVRADSPASSPIVPKVPSGGARLFDGQTTGGWSVENDDTSLAAISVASLTDGARVVLKYGLSGGAAVGQYAAAAVEAAGGVAGWDGVAFSIRAEHPMRVSVQVRTEMAGAAPERWERSVYVDAVETSRLVRFSEMTPVGTTHAAVPPPDSVRAIMFVVDTTNSRPGASGRLWVGNPRLVSAP
ncbi:MAG TPA: hypothetical protein VM032_18645 [Vicinamibacterales bacterium]|nr:hypothetical protein [Vicinamibacterales bacterium]